MPNSPILPLTQSFRRPVKPGGELENSLLAAQILPFPTLVPASKPVMFKPLPVPHSELYRQNTPPKVLTMTKHRRQPLRTSAGRPHDMLSKIEQEFAEGYVEVEITGMSFRRLLCVYVLLSRSAWSYTAGGIRSLLRIDPATQA